MAVLHIINKSPFETASLDSCLRLAKQDSAILLIEDAIYAAQKNTRVSSKLEAALGKHPVYALQPDLEARGIEPERLIDGISLVDYNGFVQLATEYRLSQSWL